MENIFDAAREGHLNTVKNHVENGANVNVPNDNGDYPLHWAAVNDHLEIVKYLVEKGALFNVENRSGNTPLHWSAGSGRLSVVKYFVELGADFHVKNNEDLTPLQEAARNGHLNVVRYLVEEKNADISGEKTIHAAAQGGSLYVVEYFVDEKHTNINVQNNYGNTPLHIAASEGHLDIVKYLVTKGADIHIRNNDGNTPLKEAIAFNSSSDVIKYLREEENKQNIFDAAKNGNLDTVKYFVEVKRVDVNHKDGNGKTALHRAVLNDHLNVVTYLIDGNHINVNVLDDSNHTSLHEAAYYGYLDIVKYLVEKGANLNVKSNEGETPLHKAAWNGKLDVVKFLVEENADFNVKDNKGRTPLQFAEISGRPDIVEYLREKEVLSNSNNNTVTNIFDAAKSGNLDAVKRFVENEGVNVNTTDSNGKTPLHRAALNGHLNVIRYLVDGKHINVDVGDYSDHTSLHDASFNGYLDVVKYLIEKGANLNVKSKDGETPLHKAAWNGKLDVVKYLVEKNVDFNVKDNKGRTPLQLAESNGKSDIVQYLTQVGATRNRRSIQSKDLSEEVKVLKQRDVQTENMLVSRNNVTANSWGTNGGSSGHEQKQSIGQRNRDKRYTEHDDVGKKISEGIASSGTRSTSLINNLFGWARNSFERLSSKPEGTSNASSISKVDALTDVNGIIMVLDLLIRKVTGQKYISTIDQSISSQEAQSYALNIIDEFVNVLNETAIKSGISVTNLNFDSVKTQLAILEQTINGRFSEIPRTLYSCAKEACPEFKQSGKFLASFKSNLEEILAKKETILLEQESVQIADQQVSRTVVVTEFSKKPDTFLKGTSVIQGINML